jgi:chromosomal replication initiation ATPase DnaA
MTAERPRQLSLALPHRPAMSRADFLYSRANREAISLIDWWPEWPDRPVLISGPAGSGKSHLVEIWRNLAGAAVVAAAALSSVEDPLGGRHAIAVEDLHAGPFDETALFHLLNRAAERKAAILMTSRLAAGALAVQLPDLASRLRAALPIELQAPDDDLLRRVLIKLFADRQLAIDPGVVDFLVARMERSLEAANRIVERLDRDALAEGRAITKRFAAAAIDVATGEAADRDAVREG